MNGTFTGLHIAKSGIFTQQAALNVTANNISNASTDGYSRQRAVISSRSSSKAIGIYEAYNVAKIGGGAVVDIVESLRSKFIDAKVVNQSSIDGFKSSAYNMLKQVEGIINEPGTANLREQMNAYWSAWETLANDPADTSLRRCLVNQTEKMIASFQEIESQLVNLQGSQKSCYEGSIEDQVRETVDKINKLGANIADLNVQIGRLETTTDIANELRDQRQKALEDLAELINVESFYNKKGQLTVNCGLHTLVSHSQFKKLSVAYKNGDSCSSITGIDSYPEYSSDPSVATAALTHTANQSNITITVSQLAKAHSQYSSLTYHPINGPLSNFGISSGSYYINGSEFFMDAENTSIEDLANIITQANVNINASINEGGQLILNAAQTGTKYEIKTQDGTSNLFTVLNLKNQTQAQDAMFSFGGHGFVRSSNVVNDALEGVSIMLNSKGVADLDLKPIVKKGKLKGLMQVRDGVIENALQGLNELAYTIVSETNQLHRVGYGLDGITERNFFASLDYISVSEPWRGAIKNMALDKSILASLNSIAAANGSFESETAKLRVFNGAGDSEIAIAISELKNKYLFTDNTATIDDFYNQIVSKIAGETANYESEAEYSNSLLTQLKANQQSYSGVSLDEELANLLQFQHAYNASAKCITVIDEMLDKIINGMF